MLSIRRPSTHTRAIRRTDKRVNAGCNGRAPTCPTTPQSGSIPTPCVATRRDDRPSTLPASIASSPANDPPSSAPRRFSYRPDGRQLHLGMDHQRNGHEWRCKFMRLPRSKVHRLTESLHIYPTRLVKVSGQSYVTVHLLTETIAGSITKTNFPFCRIYLFIRLQSVFHTEMSTLFQLLL